MSNTETRQGNRYDQPNYERAERVGKFVGTTLAKGVELVLLPVTAPGELITGYSALDDRKLTARERYVDRSLATVALFARAAKPAIDTISRAQDVSSFGINAGKTVYRTIQKIRSGENK